MKLVGDVIAKMLNEGVNPESIDTEIALLENEITQYLEERGVGYGSDC